MGFFAQIPYFQPGWPILTQFWQKSQVALSPSPNFPGKALQAIYGPLKNWPPFPVKNPGKTKNWELKM